MAATKDPESGEMDSFAGPRARLLSAKTFVGGVVALGLMGLVLAIGLVASDCKHSLRPGAELLHAEHMVSETAHELVVRGEGGDRAFPLRSVANLAANFAAASVNGTAAAETARLRTAQTPAAPSGRSTASSNAAPAGVSVVSVPVSTRTDLSTVYSIRGTVAAATVRLTETETETETETATVTPSASSAGLCSAAETVSVYVTVAPLTDKIVTGDASTATRVHTRVSLTPGVPHVTLPGRPSTRTAVLTDVSLTHPRPDANVSGSPETLTDVETDVSVTTRLPDATVSADASTVTRVEMAAAPTREMPSAVTTVVTRLWDPVRSSRRAATPTATVHDTAAAVVTITISDLYGPAATPSRRSSALAEAATGPGSDPGPGAYTTETVTVTRTGGPPATSVTTVHMTPAHNATAAGYPYSSGAVASTALVEVSRAASKPHPGGWRGGSVTLGCLVMLLTVVSAL